jgi:hypothetical protein
MLQSQTWSLISVFFIFFYCCCPQAKELVVGGILCRSAALWLYYETWCCSWSWPACCFLSKFGRGSNDLASCMSPKTWLQSMNSERLDCMLWTENHYGETIDYKNTHTYYCNDYLELGTTHKIIPLLPDVPNNAPAAAPPSSGPCCCSSPWEAAPDPQLLPFVLCFAPAPFAIIIWCSNITNLWTVATGVHVVVGWVHHKALDPQVTKTHKNNKKAADWKKSRSRN